MNKKEKEIFVCSTRVFGGVKIASQCSNCRYLSMVDTLKKHNAHRLNFHRLSSTAPPFHPDTPISRQPTIMQLAMILQSVEKCFNNNKKRTEERSRETKLTRSPQPRTPFVNHRDGSPRQIKLNSSINSDNYKLRAVLFSGRLTCTAIRLSAQCNATTRT